MILRYGHRKQNIPATLSLCRGAPFVIPTDAIEQPMIPKCHRSSWRIAAAQFFYDAGDLCAASLLLLRRALATHLSPAHNRVALLNDCAPLSSADTSAESPRTSAAPPTLLHATSAKGSLHAGQHISSSIPHCNSFPLLLVFARDSPNSSAMALTHPSAIGALLHLSVFCFVDVLCYLCSDRNLASLGTALERPVFVLLPEGAGLVRCVE
ncbi:hypothetical protein B296_00000943 [Ensete ventricosum]|uniref:Uncharacterized protein n=1 Tax=Ensete ventricosum TaxID=4639 RepID=A0A427ANT8_ENSVE|nr:hypothetical protein B296_00000943 [Ensete ventricosum]